MEISDFFRDSIMFCDVFLEDVLYEDVMLKQILGMQCDVWNEYK